MRELREVRDPDAIEALESVFKGRPAMAEEVLRVIGQMPGAKATFVLLRAAMLSQRLETRLVACEQLRNRPQYAYVPFLMSALSSPLEARLEADRDADGVHFRQIVRREGASSAVEHTLQTNVTTLVPNANLGLIIGAAYNETLLERAGQCQRNRQGQSQDRPFQRIDLLDPWEYDRAVPASQAAGLVGLVARLQ